MAGSRDRTGSFEHGVRGGGGALGPPLPGQITPSGRAVVVCKAFSVAVSTSKRRGRKSNERVTPCRRVCCYALSQTERVRVGRNTYKQPCSRKSRSFCERRRRCQIATVEGRVMEEDTQFKKIENRAELYRQRMEKNWGKTSGTSDCIVHVNLSHRRMTLRRRVWTSATMTDSPPP